MKKEVHDKFPIEFEKYGNKFSTEVTLNHYVAYRAKEIKNQKKLSCNFICERGGLSNHTIVSRILNGSHSLNMDTLYCLCKGLDCTASDLLPF
jgi:DNA-binding Xre family transcriptional regulator